MRQFGMAGITDASTRHLNAMDPLVLDPESRSLERQDPAWRWRDMGSED